MIWQCCGESLERAGNRGVETSWGAIAMVQKREEASRAGVGDTEIERRE